MNTREYNRCVDLYSDNLYRFVFGITRQRTVAEDIIQESFARLWECKSKVENGKDKSYLFTIAYRLAISELRSRNRTYSSDWLSELISATKEYDNMTELLYKALDTLSDTQRSMIMLCDWEGYSYNEIADITQNTLPQVKINIHRARNTIKTLLEDEYRV